MRVVRYGMPSEAMLDQCADAVSQQLIRICRRFAETPSRDCTASLLGRLAGIALLGRLSSQRQLEQSARKAFRQLNGRVPAPDPERVTRLCMGLLYAWSGRREAVRLYQAGLERHREQALDELRLQSAGAVPSRLVQRCLALDRIADGRSDDTCTTANNALACRQLLPAEGSEVFLQASRCRLQGLTGQLFSTDVGQTRSVLYCLARELLQLKLVAELCRVALPVPLIRQLGGLVMLHLRTVPSDWPRDSLMPVLRLLLVLHSQLDGGRPALDESVLLRGTGQFLHNWSRAVSEEPVLSACDDGLTAAQARQEIRADIMSLARLARHIMRPRELAAAGAYMAKLHLNLRGLGMIGPGWWADSLQQSLLHLLQSGAVAGSEWRRRLQLFRQRVLMEQGAEPCTGVVDAWLDEVRIITARPVVPLAACGVSTDAGGIREPAPVRNSLIGQLSGALQCIPDPSPLLAILADPDSTMRHADRLRALQRELDVLEQGARALGVHRVEALTRVLALVYRQSGLMTEPATERNRPDPALIQALRRGHAGLLHRLDQAAAWQEVSRPRPVIERLYRSLESHRTGVGGARAGAMTQRRCLAINRRVYDLLVSISSIADLREQRALLTTLLHDQARLLQQDPE